MTPGTPIAISVVVCSRNRAESLQSVLERFAGLLADPDWNLVLVDDGSTDETPAGQAGRAARFGARITERRTAGLGLGAARNVGWRAASEPVVLFTDDDCYPAPDLFDQLRRCFADDSVAFTGGRLLPDTEADGQVAIVSRTTVARLHGPMFVPAGFIPGANLAVRREALERVGGFDDELGAGTPFPAEDVDLVARLVWAGLDGIYDPGPVVYHRHGRHDRESQRRLLDSYDRGRGAYYAKCLADRRMRSVYLRAWVRTAWRGSWPRAFREASGAVRYWTRRRR